MPVRVHGASSRALPCVGWRGGVWCVGVGVGLGGVAVLIEGGEGGKCVWHGKTTKTRGIH